MSSAEAYVKARKLIDEAHQQDPLYQARSGTLRKADSFSSSPLSVGDAQEEGEEEDGKQDEMAYADAMEKWIVQLVESTEGAETSVKEIRGGMPILRLAGRCQHLARFKTPRTSYPDGKAGYLKWRRDLYTIQANRARELLQQSGISQEECDDVATWVSKKDLRPGKEEGLWGTQLLEDAAILVFLQDQLARFAASHTGYTREKFVDIIRKTWRKLSNDGKQAAKKLEMPDGLKGIIAEATQDTTGVEAGR